VSTARIVCKRRSRASPAARQRRRPPRRGGATFYTALHVTGEQPPDKRPQFGADAPLGRPGPPAELAGIDVLRASPESSCSTGRVFVAVAGRGGAWSCVPHEGAACGDSRRV